MELREWLRQAFESIADHPRRVIASAMGVFWGSAAILVMLGWGTGFTSFMIAEMGRFGRPSIFLIPGVTSSGFPGYRAGVRVRGSRRDARVAGREKRGRQYNDTHRPDNRLLLVPSTSAEARLGFDGHAVSMVTVYLRQGVTAEEVLPPVLASLGGSAGFHPEDEDALRHFDMSRFIRMFQRMDLAFTVFLGIAGTVTLLVGGVGIANYHLATLEERAVEVGVCKAIGARSLTLMLQAALESALVAGTSALLGLGVGLGGCLALEYLTPEGMFPVPVVSATAIVITLCALMGVSVIAAGVPALRVRTMDVSAAVREGL